MATLSSPRSVCNVRVESPEWTLPAGAQPENGFTIPRGTVVFFSGNNIHVGNEALTASAATGGLGVGVFAEAITKSQRVPAGAPKPAGMQKPRKRRRYNGHVAPEIAVPVTFYGLDLLFSPEPHDGFAPGDSVFAASSVVGSNSSYVLTKAPLPLSGVAVRHLGTATASAEPRTHLVEVFVSPTTNTVNFSDENFLKQVGTAYTFITRTNVIKRTNNAILMALNKYAVAAGIKNLKIEIVAKTTATDRLNRSQLGNAFDNWVAFKSTIERQISGIGKALAANVTSAVNADFNASFASERRQAINAAIQKVSPNETILKDAIEAKATLQELADKEKPKTKSEGNKNLDETKDEINKITTTLQKYLTDALAIAQNTTFQ